MAEDEQNNATTPINVPRTEEIEDMTMELSLSDLTDLRVQDTRVDPTPEEDTAPVHSREASTVQLRPIRHKNLPDPDHTHVLDPTTLIRQVKDSDPDAQTLSDEPAPAAIEMLRTIANLSDGSTQSFEIPAALIQLAQSGQLDETSLQLPHITEEMLRQLEPETPTTLEESTTPEELHAPETEVLEFVADVDAQGCIRVPFALLEARILTPGTRLHIRAKIIKE